MTYEASINIITHLWPSLFLLLEKGTTKDEMVGWHHRLNGLEFEGQGSLVCYSPWSCKESDTTEWLNNNSNLSHLFLYTLTFAFFATTKWAPTWHYIWNYSAGPAESLLALLHIFTQTAHSQCSFRGHICILTLQIPLCKYSLSPLLVYFIPNNTLYIALIPCYRLYIGQVFFFFYCLLTCTRI